MATRSQEVGRELGRMCGTAVDVSPAKCLVASVHLAGCPGTTPWSRVSHVSPHTDLYPLPSPSIPLALLPDGSSQYSHQDAFIQFFGWDPVRRDRTYLSDITSAAAAGSNKVFLSSVEGILQGMWVRVAMTDPGGWLLQRVCSKTAGR
jgi:hypothetical protein